MKQSRKLILALVLVMSILMTLAVAVIPASAAGTESGSVNVFFKDDWGWSNIQVIYNGKYYYMTKITTHEGKNVWGAVVPTGVSIKFGGNQNDSSYTGWRETTSIASSKVYDGVCFYPSWNNGVSTGSFNLCTYNTYFTNLTRCVAGTTGLTGYDWNPAKNKMTHVGGGKYEITFEDVFAGSYEFKVTIGSWDGSWPSQNQSITLTEKADVTIGYNAVDNSISVEIHAHSYSSSVTTAATCTTTGVKTFTCSCGDSYTETIDALDHDWSETISSDDTHHWYACERTNCTAKKDEATHTYTNYTSNNDATCTADGTKTGTCTCGATDTIVDEGSATGHINTTTTTVAATCDKVGSVTVTCSCGHVVSTTELPVDANAHFVGCGHYAAEGDTLNGDLADADKNVELKYDVNLGAEALVVGSDAVLNLNGNTVYAVGARITGKICGDGSLVVTAGALAYEEDGQGIVPVRVAIDEEKGTETYIFREAKTLTAEAPEGYDYFFRPTLSGYGVTNKDIFCGEVNNGLTLKLKVTRTPVVEGEGEAQSAYVTISDETIREVYAKTSTGFAVTLTGESDAYNYSVEFVIVSCGVEVYTAPIAYVPKTNEEENQ